MSVTIGEAALFGPDFTILVDLITNAPSLHRLHADLLVALALHADIAIDVPQFALAGYRPHVTVTSTARANSGNRYTLGQLALVDMAPAGRSELRVVIATCELDHGDKPRLQ